jgi:hypothetical protein
MKKRSNTKSILCVIFCLFAFTIPLVSAAGYGAYWIGSSSGIASQLSTVAKSYNLFILGGSSSTYLSSLNGYTGADIFTYKHIGCNQASETHSSCRYQDIKDSTWWLRRDGAKVCDPAFSSGSTYNNNVCYLDISNQAVRSYMISRYRSMTRDTPYDGVFIDIAHDSLHYYGGATDEIKTNAEALSSYKAFLRETKAALNGVGKKVIPNFAGVSDRGHWAELIPYTDGAMEEAFYTDGDGSKWSYSKLTRQLNDCKTTVSQGKYYIGVVKLTGTTAQKESMWQAAKLALDKCGSSKALLAPRTTSYSGNTILAGISLR